MPWTDEEIASLLSPSTLGGRLRAARAAMRYSQAQVAKRLRIHAMTLSKWENDVHQPATAHLAVLAEMYGIPIDNLLSGVVGPRARTEAQPARVHTTPLAHHSALLALPKTYRLLGARMTRLLDDALQSPSRARPLAEVRLEMRSLSDTMGIVAVVAEIMAKANARIDTSVSWEQLLDDVATSTFGVLRSGSTDDTTVPVDAAPNGSEAKLAEGTDPSPND